MWPCLGCLGSPHLPRRSVNILREHLHVLDGRRRQNAMTEVEDMPWTSAGASEDIFCLIEHSARRAEQERGVEIALHGAGEADLLPGLVSRDAPVATDPIATRPPHLSQ